MSKVKGGVKGAFLDSYFKQSLKLTLCPILRDLKEVQLPMFNNKAPEPDGFPTKFYEEFWQLLAPVSHKMVNFVKESRALPINMNPTNIILPLKDPTLPSSYHPIYLINTDLKIICKTLARTLELVTPHIIHPDQTGFVEGRYDII